MSFLSYLKDGINLGSIYAIIALGYTMVYGIAKMLNFAHGDVIMGWSVCDPYSDHRSGDVSCPGSAFIHCILYSSGRSH